MAPPESYNEDACPRRFWTLADFMRTHTIRLTLLVLGVVFGTLRSGVPIVELRAQQTPPPKPAADQPPITFKVEVNYVEIDAIVTDQQGNFVRDLTKDDFEVVERGKPQSVSIASLVDIPVEKFDPPLFKTKPVEPDVRSNSKEFNGRVFVLVLDDLNTSFTRSARVKLAARQFIERYLGANDVAAIVQTGGAKATAQEFTGSRERLLRAVNNFMGNKERSGTLERIDEYLPDARHRRHRTSARSERTDPRLQGEEHVYRPQERCRLHGWHPRPPQSRRVLQRRGRLRHLRSHHQHLRERHPAVPARMPSPPPRAPTSVSTRSIPAACRASTMPRKSRRCPTTPPSTSG